MIDNMFSFLNKINKNLYDIWNEMDKIIYKNPYGAVVKGKLFAEIFSKEIAKKETLIELLSLNQVYRVIGLAEKNIIPKDIAIIFDTIRVIGNKRECKDFGRDLEVALKIRENLYKIIIWYGETYEVDVVLPKYRVPLYYRNEGKNILEKELAITKDVDKDEKKLQGSHLLYELSKLKESAQEAVENSEKLSSFKKYMHIKRPIEEELFQVLQKVSNKSESQLIFLCGSVGDGKSHLLGYMNEKYKSLMENFYIHNDATESFNPHKSSIDTLSEVLRPFSDEFIDTSKVKFILAINLGVLHNFIESDYAKEKFKRLSNFIYNSNIFDKENIANNYDEENFKLISFSDYHLYELTSNGPKSQYIMSLLDKIVNKDKTNPFYRAYLMDLEREYPSLVIKNYNMLAYKGVKKKICELIIQAVVQYKLIISTRELLNFIYDILVPPNLQEEELSLTSLEAIEGLFTNLLFGRKDGSILLKAINKLDPINNRSQEMDKMLVELNNSNSIYSVFEKYLNVEEINNLINLLRDFKGMLELTTETRNIVEITFIRLVYFFGYDAQKIFFNKIYENYMKYLYFYNVELLRGYKDLYKEVEKAIFLWKGSPKNQYVYFFEENPLVTLKIAEKLEFKPNPDKKEEKSMKVIQRFKNTIKLKYLVMPKNKNISLEIDYPLYEKIIKINKGYCPNKKDRENSITFVEFIEKLIKLGNKNEEILVCELKDNIMFKLKYDSIFNEFTFKRE